MYFVVGTKICVWKSQWRFGLVLNFIAFYSISKVKSKKKKKKKKKRIPRLNLHSPI